MFTAIALSLLGLALLGSLVRVVLGPSIWDRLLGLGLGASKISLMVIIVYIRLGESYILDLALLFAILGFLVVLLIARYIEKRGVL